MRPASGGSNPSVSFRIVLLPAPATPNNAFVSPNGSWNETPHNTSVSSNERCTSSKITAALGCPSGEGPPWPAGDSDKDMQLPVREHRDQQLRQEEVGD